MIRVFDDTALLIKSLAEFIRAAAKRAVASRGRFVMALSGGNSPRSLYELLGQDQSLPWDVTHLFMVDERFVPSDDKDYNGAMIKKALGLNQPTAGGARPDRLYVINTNTATAAEAADLYASRLETFFGTSTVGNMQFDLILLGMGADGHTASLFPDTGAIDVTDRSVIAVKPATAPHDRISLTLPIINQSLAVAFSIAGADKAQTLQSVIEDGQSPYPAARVKPLGQVPVFFVDRSAAAYLSGSQ